MLLEAIQTFSNVFNPTHTERPNLMNTDTTIHPMRVHVAMQAEILGRTIKQIIGEPVRFIDTASEADLIIFDSVRKIEKDFDKTKSYLCIWGVGGSGYITKPANLPENVTVVHGADLLTNLLTLLSDLSKKLTPIADVVATSVEEVIPTRPDALRILVIDDTAKHIASAKKGLAGHRLTTATGYQEAMELLGKEKFDVVLTDLHLPMSSKTMGDKFKLGELVPYGILLMIEAARQGAKKVAVVTDLSHHDDPFSAAFDHYSQFPISIEGAKVRMLHARVSDEGKDWAEALQLIAE